VYLQTFEIADWSTHWQVNLQTGKCSWQVAAEAELVWSASL